MSWHGSARAQHMPGGPITGQASGGHAVLGALPVPTLGRTVLNTARPCPSTAHLPSPRVTSIEQLTRHLTSPSPFLGLNLSPNKLAQYSIPFPGKSLPQALLVLALGDSNGSWYLPSIKSSVYEYLSSVKSNILHPSPGGKVMSEMIESSSNRVTENLDEQLTQTVYKLLDHHVQ